MQALIAVSGREVGKFVQQRGRLLSALVRPALWLLVFGWFRARKTVAAERAREATS